MTQSAATGMARIARPNVYQLVANQLMAEIVDLDLAEGDPVPTEKELSERYGVGRSSVREGLRMLESQGVIELSGRGTYSVGSRQRAMARALETLLTLGAATLLDIHVLRRSIEIEAAGLAAVERNGEDLADLEGAIDAMAEAGTDRNAALDADLAFHLALARASHNGALVAATLGVREVLRGLIATRLFDSAEAVRQHRAILAAIEAGDADAARERTAAHMRWISDSLDGKE